MRDYGVPIKFVFSVDCKTIYLDVLVGYCWEVVSSK